LEAPYQALAALESDSPAFVGTRDVYSNCNSPYNPRSLSSAKLVIVISLVEKCEEFYYIPFFTWSYLPTSGTLAHSRKLPRGDSKVMLTIFNRLLSLAAIWLVLTVAYGCSACISPCLFGPSVSIGSNAGQAGVSRYETGRVKSFELARYEDVVEATRRAGEAISLELREEVTDTDQTTLYYIAGKNEKVEVLIERQTDTLTYIQIDVGFFGSKGLAFLMINQIIHEISMSGDYLQEWSHKEVL